MARNTWKKVIITVRNTTFHLYFPKYFSKNGNFIESTRNIG